MRLAGIAAVITAVGELASCGCPDDGTIITYTGTDVLAPAQGIIAMEYLVTASPPPSCASVLAAFQTGQTPSGTIYKGIQKLAPVYAPDIFVLVPPPARKSGCRAGSATGTFASLMYDSVDPVCFEPGCPPVPPLIATACAESVTFYADRITRLELPVHPVP